MPRLPCARLIGALCLLAPLSMPARAATQESQAWVSELATIRIDDANTLTIDSSQRLRSDARSGGEQFLARVALDRQIAPLVQMGGGFAYLKSEDDQELRLFQEAILSKGIWLAHTRMEQRFFDTADTPSWRLRQRVQASVAVDRAKRWTVIAAGEIFFHLNRARANDKTGLAMMRQQIGLRRSLGKILDAQMLYMRHMRQQNLRDGRPDVVSHIPWLTLSWRL
ncbi:DUF2490 domain-containing protein [Sphingobium sp.]|uniref:DUF2490 domain-containing protein n=1 Tax=Sphingobium sp. TaxID=1912891 RepID=UPI003B3A69D1